MASKKSRTKKGRKSKRRSKQKRLSKHMVRAIKAIALQPIETKSYPVSANIGAYLASATYGGGMQAVIRSNIYSELPRIKNTSQKTEESFIGNTIMSRGLRWQMDAYTITAAALAPDITFRYTVYRDSQYYQGITGPAAGDRIFDQDMNNTATWAHWNPQTTKIMFRRTFKLAQGTQTTGMLHRKFYIPLRKKITAVAEESLITNTFMRETKGGNYYWVLEIFSPNVIDLSEYINGSIGTRLYFKDA